MDLVDFLKEFVVSTLFSLDLKDPDHIRDIEDAISIVEVGRGRFRTDAAKLLAASLGQEAQKFASEILVLFELETFVEKASADHDGNIVLNLKIPQAA